MNETKPNQKAPKVIYIVGPGTVCGDSGDCFESVQDIINYGISSGDIIGKYELKDIGTIQTTGRFVPNKKSKK